MKSKTLSRSRRPDEWIQWEIRAFLLLCFAAILTFPIPAAGGQTIPNVVPTVTARLRPLQRLAPTNRLDLAIEFPLRNPEQLDLLLRQLSDPASPNFRRYLTPEKFTSRFGPTEADYQAAIAFAEANNLRPTTRHPNRMLLNVNGSVGDVERTFHLKMWVYQHPTEARTFYAPDTEPTIDLPVRVLGISGLNNHGRPRPMYVLHPLSQGGNPQGQSCGSGPSGEYWGMDFRALYAPDTALTGSGQIVGLVEFNGYALSDITSYEKLTGLPSVTLSNALVDGFNGQPGGAAQLEVDLDIEMAISMAPGLSEIIVYECGPSGNWHDVLNRMADDNLASQMSCSWYYPMIGPDPVAEQIFQQMAAQGQSMFCASGDSGSYQGDVNPAPSVKIGFPCDSPHVTLVGGTELPTNCLPGSVLGETVWDGTEGVYGSGGGYSFVYAIPWWQTNIDMTDNEGSITMRNIPDVAMLADNICIYGLGTNYPSGGTSAAAPLWAGFAALVNQQAAMSWWPPVGFINPALDMIGTSASYTACFHDITSGNNTNQSSSNLFFAVPGYDLCTGWGTPAGQSLITALGTPDSLAMQPRTGFAAIGGEGGPFTIISESFALTNSGADSLEWSLVNTSSWLAVSPPNGSLAPGDSGSTSVNLSVGAYSLPTGNYTATVAFSNISLGLAQSVPFTLQIVPSIPPSIIRPPIHQWAALGANASFNVTAGGTPPFSYQWQFNSTNINAATDALLTLTNVNFNDAGTYAVTVADTLGSTNASAVLTVVAAGHAPSIAVQPQSQELLQGSIVTFTVDAGGTGPLNYQWYFDGSELALATNSTLSLTNVQGADEGFYRVSVSDPFGSVLSSFATLTVDGVFLGASARLIGSSSGMDSVVLAVTQNSLSWTNTADAPWLHLTMANQTGAGSANVIFSYDANSGATRSGTLTIAGQALTVIQAGSTYVQDGTVTVLVATGSSCFPGGVAVDGAGNVYWSQYAQGFDYGSSATYKWTVADNMVTQLAATGLDDREDVAVDNVGNVYITDIDSNAICEWMTDSNDLITLISTGLNNPWGVAVDRAANVYIADTFNDAVKKWTSANSNLTTLVSSGLNKPFGVAVDIAGNVYITDANNNAVKKWTSANSNVTTLVSSGVSSPWGIAVDGAGNVYFADHGSGTIKKWTAVNGTVTTLVSGLSPTVGVAADGTGNIYFSDPDTNEVKELPYAFVDPTPRLETTAAGSDSLPVVLPATENLLPPFNPTSDQSWLTITGITNGVVSFSFTADTGAARTANISLLGQTIPVTQGVIATPPTLTGAQMLTNGVLQFVFTNDPGESFTVLSATNLSLPLSGWTVVGEASNTAPGLFQFTSQPTTNDPQHFYRVRSP